MKVVMQDLEFLFSLSFPFRHCPSCLGYQMCISIIDIKSSKLQYLVSTLIIPEFYFPNGNSEPTIAK